MFQIIQKDPATRRFEMVIGLLGGKVLHSMEAVEEIILSWHTKERRSNGVYLPGRIDFNVMLALDAYDHPIKIDVAIYRGIVTTGSNTESENHAVVRSLERLAVMLAKKFEQPQITFTYRQTLYTVADSH